MTWERIDSHAGEPGRRPNLVEGDRGPGVALLQRLLGVTETGYFGAATRKAVDAFQRGQGWEPSGVGPMSWAALDKGAAAAPATTASSGPLTVGGVNILDQCNIDFGGTGFAAAGMLPLLNGGTQLATGPATLGTAPVAGGAEVRAIKVATEIGKDVISKSPQVWREARALQGVVQAGRVATQAAPVVAAEGATIGVAGTLAVVGLVWLAEAAIILVLNEAFLAAGRPSREESPPGGTPEPAQAPGTPVPAPVTDPGAVNPALAPGTDGNGPALAPGKDPPTPAMAPGASDEELKLKVPDPVKVTRPQQNWWPEISAVAPDWGQKGAHIKINDVELAVRPVGPGIVLPPVLAATWEPTTRRGHSAPPTTRSTTWASGSGCSTRACARSSCCARAARWNGRARASCATCCASSRRWGCSEPGGARVLAHQRGRRGPPGGAAG